MRIIHYIPSIDRRSGGVGSYLQLLSCSLGKIVDLHIISHRSENELPIENCTIHYIDKRLMYLLKAKKEFKMILLQVNPDVVHVNSCWEVLSSYTVFWTQALGYPVVLTPHGMLEPWVMKKNYWNKKLPALIAYQKHSLKMANALIATAESERKNLIVLKYNKHIEVVPNGIVIEHIKIKKSWESNKLIFFLALLRPNKGAELLIQAVANLKEELNGYRVIIAGTGQAEYTNLLRELIQKFKLEDTVLLLGSVFGDEKWNLYKEADVFVLPTLNENFGIVIAEALASGTPVITTKGAPWSSLVEEKCGWWVDRTLEDVIMALREFLALSIKERELMGRRGRKLVEDNFTSEKVAETMYKLYQKYKFTI